MTPAPETLNPSLRWNGLEFRRLGAAAVAADIERWASMYREVYSASSALAEHSDPPIEDRIAGHVERPGFELVAAYDESDVVGEEPFAYVYGYQLPADTPWWEGLTPEPDPELVREYPGRTAAICEALVGSRHRQAGLGETLLGYFLLGRPEERATALVALANAVILDRFTSRGWHALGQMEPKEGWAPHAALLLPLR